METKQGTIEYLENKIRNLEKIVGCLCITNFMTDHKDGDEEAREDSVRIINYQARQAKAKYEAYERHHDLYLMAKERTEEMLVLEQDYPELKNRYKDLFKGLV